MKVGETLCKALVLGRMRLTVKRTSVHLYAGALSVAVLITPALSAQDKAVPSPSADVAADAKPKAGPPAGDENIFLRRFSNLFPESPTARAPLTAGQKFRLSLKNSVAPTSLLLSAAAAAISQGADSTNGYPQGAAGYGKRFGASMASRSATNFLGGFVFPAIAREDPRYFRDGKGSVNQRLTHAISRVVLAPKDRGGYGFNWGGVLGPLGAEAFSNVYQPAYERSGGRTMKRYGVSLAAAAPGNILKEFWPDIFKRFEHLK